MASPFHGKRLSTEAAMAIQAWGDETLATEETSCIVATRNTPSIYLAQKIGFETMEECLYNEEPHLVVTRQRS